MDILKTLEALEKGSLLAVIDELARQLAEAKAELEKLKQTSLTKSGCVV